MNVKSLFIQLMVEVAVRPHSHLVMSFGNTETNLNRKSVVLQESWRKCGMFTRQKIVKVKLQVRSMWVNKVQLYLLVYLFIAVAKVAVNVTSVLRPQIKKDATSLDLLLRRTVGLQGSLLAEMDVVVVIRFIMTKVVIVNVGVLNTVMRIIAGIRTLQAQKMTTFQTGVVRVEAVIHAVQCIVSVIGEGQVIVEDLTIRVRG